MHVPFLRQWLAHDRLCNTRSWLWLTRIVLHRACRQYLPKACKARIPQNLARIRLADGLEAEAEKGIDAKQEVSFQQGFVKLCYRASTPESAYNFSTQSAHTNHTRLSLKPQARNRKAKS